MEKEDNIMEQGSTYEEDSDIEMDNTEEETQDKNTLLDFSNPIVKYGIVLVGIVLLVIVLVIGISVAKKKDVETAPDFMLEEEDEDDTEFRYSEEEKSELRAYGYTGYDIEEFEKKQADFQEIIDEAKEQKEQQLKRDIKPYYDKASKEVKELYKDSWVGQADLKYKDDPEDFDYITETINVDYKKLPPKGHQLFIKYKLDDGQYCFMTVSPERYSQLKDEGNIVLSVDYVITVDNKRIITDATEVIPGE